LEKEDTGWTGSKIQTSNSQREKRREEILRCKNQIFLRIKSRRGLIKNTVCWGEVGK
jgi:hypothetical protein